MKKFLFKVIILCSLLLIMLCSLFFAFFVCVPDQYTTSYEASIIDKIERLKSIEEPKIILVGNSNLSFGINSQLIIDEFGMPVVNLGLHGSLGNAFHEEMAKFHIGEGDVVIVCHSSYSDNGLIANTDLAWKTLERNTEYYTLIGENDREAMMNSFPIYIKDSLTLILNGMGNRSINGVYSRAAFNEWGDIEWERLENKFEFTGEVSPPNINSICVDRLNALNEYCILQGATLVVAGYPIGYGELTKPQEEFEKFQQELEEQLDFSVISQFTDYFIDYKYFYNTNLHLTTEGAEIRTKLLIEDIKAYLKNL